MENNRKHLGLYIILNILIMMNVYGFLLNEKLA